MSEPTLARRLRRLPSIEVLGCRVHLAQGYRARLLGLAFLSRERAGAGLLIPRCVSVHTFGMLFPLDVVFLDRRGAVIEVRRELGPCRVARCRGADAVLEVPSEAGDGPPSATRLALGFRLRGR
jgi:uncharacterized membrane protein (UPF0127 family)